MTRGGKRDGAGRPCVGRVPGIAVGCTLEPSQVERLDRQAAKLGVGRRELVRRVVEAWLLSETWIRTPSHAPQESTTGVSSVDRGEDTPNP